MGDLSGETGKVRHGLFGDCRGGIRRGGRQTTDDGVNLSRLPHNGLSNQRRQCRDDPAPAYFKIPGAAAGTADRRFEIIAEGGFGTGREGCPAMTQ